MNNSTDLPPATQFRLWGQLIRQSDEQAYRELFEQTYNLLFKFTNRYVQSRDVCKDILQESYVKLWQNRSHVDESKSLKAYLYTIVRNECMNYIYADQNRTIDDEFPAEIADDQGLDDAVTDTEKTGVLQLKLDQWVSELPQRQRTAFELSRYDGLDHNEIAEVMDCAPRTVNNHIVAALKVLRSKYDRWKQKSVMD